MEFLDNVIEILKNSIGYIGGFFTFLIENANSLLSGGNVLLFVLFMLIIWKVVMKLKG